MASLRQSPGKALQAMLELTGQNVSRGDIAAWAPADCPGGPVGKRTGRQASVELMLKVGPLPCPCCPPHVSSPPRAQKQVLPHFQGQHPTGLPATTAQHCPPGIGRESGQVERWRQRGASEGKKMHQERVFIPVRRGRF